MTTHSPTASRQRPRTAWHRSFGCMQDREEGEDDEQENDGGEEDDEEQDEEEQDEEDEEEEEAVVHGLVTLDGWSSIGPSTEGERG